jgi:hypothetical protein
VSHGWLHRLRTQLFGGINTSRPTRRKPAAVRPAVECLEARELLTTGTRLIGGGLVGDPVVNDLSDTTHLSVTQWDANQPYTGTITGFGPTTAQLHAVSGLPPGLRASKSGATITLSGTPTQAGTYDVYADTVWHAGTINEVDCFGDYYLTINPALSLGSLSAAPWTVGRAGSAALAFSGGTPGYTLGVTGLPHGLTATLSSNAITFSGRPTQAGTYSVAVSLQDGIGVTVQQTRSLTVNLAVGPDKLPASDVGLGYSATFSAAGGSGRYAFTMASGVFPPGLSLNSKSGVLSGTPTVPGTYTFTVRATDAGKGMMSGAQTYALTVNPAPSLGGLDPWQWTFGQPAYFGTIAVSGGTGGYGGLTVTGLPPGLSAMLSSNAITLQGTPSQLGSYWVTLSLKDGLGAVASGSYALAANLEVSPGALPADNAGDGYHVKISAHGGSGQYAFTLASGALPPGLALSGAGLLSGTTTVAGTYTFSVGATDTSSAGAAAGVSGTQFYQLTVHPRAASQVLFSTQPPSSLIAGAEFHAAVQVEDPYGNPVPGTSVTVADGTESMTVTTDTAGRATLGNHNDQYFLTYVVAGTYRLTASVTGVATATSNAFTVLPGRVTQVVVSPSTPTPTVGTPFTVTVTATDAYGNGCTVPATLTSSDGLSRTLQVTGGTGTATVTLTAAHAVTFTATAGGVSGSVTVGVNPAPGAVAKFVVSCPATGFTNDRVTVTVTAQDGSGHTVNFNGPVALTSSDGTVVASASVMLSNGTGQVTLTLLHSGTAALSAHAGSVPSNSATVTVSPSLYQFDYELVAYDANGDQFDTEDFSVQARNEPAALATADAVGNAWAQQLSDSTGGAVDVIANPVSAISLN